jgi:tetratricopeptide (TPR) repeat protein
MSALPDHLSPNPAARAALRAAASALDAAEQQGQAHAISAALAQMAQSLAAMQALAQAETYLESALRWARAAGATDQTVDLLCALCDLAERLASSQDARAAGLGHAARERARDHAFEASCLAHRVADADWEIKVLLRVSDVLDRCGDRDDAVQLQTRALRLMAPDATAPLDPRVLPGLGRLADH